ncbi:YueI family protein [Virgibacillus halophilus]|uniref:YueI family protein n=1 Tax=Tigheibacillus halophilus TaxID=361280 RepID=A0ABU5C7G1_9BACI|nr:YueI family protein [Virgibacillus halophilus]
MMFAEVIIVAPRQVDDYLQEGIYGTRLPKQAERDKFLGTLRERVILALTIGQVMTDKGIKKLEEEIVSHPEAKMVFNGEIDSKFLEEEKRVANKYNIPYSIISDVEVHTNIGAVLHYDYAIDKEDIFMPEEGPAQEHEKDHKNENKFLYRLKKLFL